MKKKNTSAHDTKFEFWPNRDVLTSQRHRLKEKRRAGGGLHAEAAREEPAPRVNERVAEPPPALYEVESVYRFTRGNNDLTNPGMGYGELTEEAAWELQEDGTLLLRSFFVRRTRSARRRLETTEPRYVPSTGVVSQYPKRGGEKGK